MQKKKEAKQIHAGENQVQFRVLCKSHTVGGLIGSNGSIIYSLEQASSAKISVNVVGPSGNERLVHVIGDHSPNRTILVDGVEKKVSAAQDALVRVFDRILAVEQEEDKRGGSSNSDVVVKCRLVVGPGMVGAVLGKAGQRITKLCHHTSASVKVLPLASPPPPGAFPSDQLIQITGAALPVKKTLVVVSQFLQQKAIEIQRGPPHSTSSHFSDRTIKMDTRETANGGIVAKVVFKLICPYRAAGPVIGCKGKKVQMIEQETKASICFSAAAHTGCDRLVTISSIEGITILYCTKCYCSRF